MRRRVVIAAVLTGLLASGAVIGVCTLTRRVDPIRYENHDRLEPGMSRADLENCRTA